MSDRRVSYSSAMRKKAVESGGKLCTVDVPGFFGQIVGDDQLFADLLRVFMDGRNRQLANRPATEATR